MAKAETVQASEPVKKTRKVCPNCGAQRFQAHQRGTFVGDEFVPDELVVQCTGCHAVFAAGGLKTVEIPE